MVGIVPSILLKISLLILQQLNEKFIFYFHFTYENSNNTYI